MPIADPAYDSTKGIAPASITPTHCSSGGRDSVKDCRFSINSRRSRVVVRGCDSILWPPGRRRQCPGALVHVAPSRPGDDICHDGAARTSDEVVTVRAPTPGTDPATRPPP
ncbi:hypothetical protein GCM10009718_18850 [Isoptericola halotolerans]